MSILVGHKCVGYYNFIIYNSKCEFTKIFRYMRIVNLNKKTHRKPPREIQRKPSNLWFGIILKPVAAEMNLQKEMDTKIIL